MAGRCDGTGAVPGRQSYEKAARRHARAAFFVDHLGDLIGPDRAAPRAEPNDLSVLAPRRFREHDLLGPGQSRGRNPVELPVLPLPNPPVLFIKVILQL